MQGIYMIKNAKNKMVYIGSSYDILKRWKEHIALLEKNKHHSYKLQSDWNKYNIYDFNFLILECVEERKDLIEREIYYVKKYNSTNNKLGYNLMMPVCEDRLKRENHLITYQNKDEYEKLKSIIKENVILHEKHNYIFKKETALSREWFRVNKSEIEKVRKCTYNFLKMTGENSKQESFVWTTFLNVSYLMKFEGGQRVFTDINSDVNKNKDKKEKLAFVANIYPNMNNSLDITKEEYALNVMLHWIINNGNIYKKFYLYIPSVRMLRLFKEWLNK